MPDFLIDTDVLIDVLKGRPEVSTALLRLPAEASKAYSVITEADLWAGLAAEDGQEAAALGALLASMQAVPVDTAAARLAGRYRRRFGPSHGTSLADALIAAAARLGGAVLLTRNRRHFPMAGLRVLTPQEAAAEAGPPGPSQ